MSVSAQKSGPLLRRVGVVDPGSIEDHVDHGGFAALQAARAMGPDAVIQAVTDAGDIVVGSSTAAEVLEALRGVETVVARSVAQLGVIAPPPGAAPMEIVAQRLNVIADMQRATFASGCWQLTTALPSISTVQQPHCPDGEQPSFGEVMSSSSRSAASRCG